MSKVFFNDPHELANLFTKKNILNYDQQKFFEVGMKAIEVFESDILTNLTEWSMGEDRGTVFYRTKEYWYTYQMEGDLILHITRFKTGTSQRWDTWINVSSCSVGKKFLAQHKDKWVPLFNVGNPTREK